MKASELRIGNWITLVKDNIYENKDYQLEAYDIYKASEFDDITQCLLPIQLTEEWLEKFGFKHYVAGETHEMYTPFGVFEIQKHKTLINGNECKHLQYVHQLQNLYFALTGEELTLKK